MLSVNCYGTSCFTGAKMINQLEIWLLYIGCWWVGTPVDMARGRCFQRVSNMKRICTRWLPPVSELVAVTVWGFTLKIHFYQGVFFGQVIWKLHSKGGLKYTHWIKHFLSSLICYIFFDVTYFHTARGPALRQVLSHQSIQCITAHPQ